jgi:hypothetical protein
LGPLPHFGAAIEFYRGWGSLDEVQAWQLRSHEVFDLWRFSSTLRLLFSAHQELAASPYAAAGFNPRAARWEEQLLVQGAEDAVGWTAGFFHRCKHDIDNSEPPDDDTSNNDYEPIKRAIVLTGVTGRLATANLFSGSTQIRTEVGAEYYVNSGDYRAPGHRDTGSWSGMRGSVFAMVTGCFALDSTLQLRTLEYINVPWFSNRYNAPLDLVFDARAEVSLAFAFAFRLELVAAVDHQFDELVYLLPAPSTVWQLGVRLSGL